MLEESPKWLSALLTKLTEPISLEQRTWRRRSLARNGVVSKLNGDRLRMPYASLSTFQIVRTVLVFCSSNVHWTLFKQTALITRLFHFSSCLSPCLSPCLSLCLPNKKSCFSIELRCSREERLVSSNSITAWARRVVYKSWKIMWIWWISNDLTIKATS